MSNIREDAIKAAHILATHSGRIKERLIAAGRTGITIHEESKIPVDLREDYNDLVKKLTQGSENGYGDGYIEQAISGISEDEATWIAREMMEFIRQLLNTPRSEFN